ncbi:hypothetical protein [Cupriavidus necator]|uniref:Uncharacterized protein n=1 Tax=Cupriavidus necator (strain ATCC 17699 / DSM 428 / KCTC 22496 / NCIMB 10442 / H16 / Stanier 337) TaxID=381666 RepID=Q0KAC8_CUPNH|nr:hypothetical protein [Cupriavidus necator]CAJ93043.1 Hypothetical protein H16_A1942 [Cupriavidus necator H16]
MDRFEADVMDELMDEAAEGPTRGSAMDLMHDDGYDESDEGNDSYDEWDEGEDNFVGRVLAGGATQYDEGEDEGDTYEDVDGIDSVDEYEAAYDELDGMEDAVADAMEAGDADEFFRRLRRMASGAVNVARRVGQGIGQAARVVGPIASMIPLPQAQLIGRIANVAGRMLADGADEYETFDELVDDSTRCDRRRRAGAGRHGAPPRPPLGRARRARRASRRGARRGPGGANGHPHQRRPRGTRGCTRGARHATHSAGAPAAAARRCAYRHPHRASRGTATPGGAPAVAAAGACGAPGHAARPRRAGRRAHDSAVSAPCRGNRPARPVPQLWRPWRRLPTLRRPSHACAWAGDHHRPWRMNRRQ